MALQRLEKAKIEWGVLTPKLEFVVFSLEDCKKKAIRTKEIYTEANLDLWKFDTDILVVKRVLEEVQQYQDAMVEQIQMMQQGERVACWPKPSLHPEVPDEFVGAFELEACLFCNQWYISFDVVMASCRHFYHPFCIARVAEMTNACVTCKKTFDPVWRKSFGFRVLEANVEDKSAMSMLARSKEELSDTLKDILESLSLTVSDYQTNLCLHYGHCNVHA